MSPNLDDFVLPATAVGAMAPAARASIDTLPATSSVMAPGESVEEGGPPIRAVTARSTSAIEVLAPTVFSPSLLSAPAIGIR